MTSNKRKHVHEFTPGHYSKGGVEVCRCGAFRFTEKWLANHPPIAGQPVRPADEKEAK